MSAIRPALDPGEPDPIANAFGTDCGDCTRHGDASELGIPKPGAVILSEGFPQAKRVLIAGATGGVGALVVKRLRQLGVTCRVLTRDAARAAKLGTVEIVEGNVLSAADCAAAAAGCDATICAIGDYRVPKDRAIVDGDGVINLADAATAAGARRFVLVSSLGSGESWDWLPFFVKWYFHAMRALPILAAKTRSDTYLRTRDLDWTILWPAFLTNRAMRAAPQLTAQGRAGGTSSRQAVADVAVRCLASPSAVGRTIVVVDSFMRFTLRGGSPFELDAPWEAWA